MRPTGVLIAVALWLAAEGRAEMVRQQPRGVEKVNTCALQADPGKYNHQLIDVRGVVSHGFGDFTLSAPGCSHSAGIWLAYGGRVDPETGYSCGVNTAKRCWIF